MAAKTAVRAEVPQAENALSEYADMERQDPENARETLLKTLLVSGAIPFVPQGRSGPDPRPIAVRGEPVSETIIAERR